MTIDALLECSFYAAPNAPGLTFDELVTAGSSLGFGAGEIGDALQHHQIDHGAGGRLIPHAGHVLPWIMFAYHDPEYRNYEALDFVHRELLSLVREHGLANAILDRAVLTARWEEKGKRRHEIDVALATLAASGFVSLQGFGVRMGRGWEQRRPPSAERAENNQRLPRNERRARALPAVIEIVSRRTDGRHQHAEPLDAFTEELTRLGHGSFRLWWQQMVAEVRRCDPQTTPVSVTVLSASLVEGALAFLVQHGRASGTGIFGSTTFGENPRTWKIEDLVKSASSGGPNAVLDASARLRADALIQARQRIHAGRMLAEHPTGVVDLRPDEAREAKATAELVVRKILDWLARQPRDGQSPLAAQ